MKSLDYRFSDDNTAIYTKKHQQYQQNQHKFQAKKLDAHAYRQKILKQKGGLASSAGNLNLDDAELQDITKSPGYRREKHMDKQRKKESMKNNNRRESSSSSSSSSVGEEKDFDSSKSSFSQCTFNMANILMGVGMLGLPYVFKSAGWIGGSCVTVGFCLVTWKTSYYLGRTLNGDPRPVHLFDGSDVTITRMNKPVSSFPEIAREAFGDNGCVVSFLHVHDQSGVILAILYIMGNSFLIAFLLTLSFFPQQNINNITVPLCGIVL